jgi:hypothetical protein
MHLAMEATMEKKILELYKYASKMIVGGSSKILTSQAFKDFKTRQLVGIGNLWNHNHMFVLASSTFLWLIYDENMIEMRIWDSFTL